MRSSSESFAVRKSTGVSVPSARTRCSTSRPSMSGSMMSSTIASGRNSRATFTALKPSAAVRTSQPSYRSAIFSSSVSECSSSTTRTRTMEPSPFVICGARWVVGVLMTPVSARGYAFPMTSMCGCRSPTPGGNP